MIAWVIASVWLGILTVVVLLLVRQTAILTVRQQVSSSAIGRLDDDGLAVGSLAPSGVLDILPPTPATILVLSSTCAPCRDFAGKLRKAKLDERSPLIALVAGRTEVATALIALLPPSVRVIQDPQASQFANELSTSSTPFGMAFANGTLVAKRFLHDVDDLRSLVDPQLMVPATRAEVARAGA